MKILYFSAFYQPETMAAAYRASENAKIWIQMGHDVTIFTGYPNYPKGYIFGGYTPKLFMKESIDGVDVIRSKVVAKKNTSFFKRLQNALSYYFFGRINIFWNKKKIGRDYDVVLGTSGVIFNALLAYKFAHRNKLPFVVEFRDITYEQMIAVGKKPKSLSVKCMKKLELKLCRKADKIVVVSNGYKKILMENGVPDQKITVITNGVDIDACDKSYEGEKRLLSYLGTIGISQELEESFEYAECIREKVNDFEYLIIGDGAKQDEIAEKARHTEYAKALTGMPMEELEPIYDQSMLSLVKLKNSNNFLYTIPSKLYQIMGRGVAVLYIGPDGEAADILRTYNAGIILSEDKKNNLETLRTFFSQSDWRTKLQKMGENGADAVQNHFSRRVLAKEYMHLLQDAASINETNK